MVSKSNQMWVRRRTDPKHLTNASIQPLFHRSWHGMTSL